MLARTDALMKPEKLNDQSSVGTCEANEGVMPPGSEPTRGMNGDEPTPTYVR
jgi:hypothetical protein